MKTAKQINGQIRGIAGRSTKLRGDIQVTACDVACHILEHGEVSLAQALLNAVGTGGNFESLAQWLGEFAFCRMKDGELVLNKHARTEALKGFCTPVDARAAYEITVSLARPWHCSEAEMTEKVEKVFDSFEAAEHLIARMLKKGDQQLAAKIRAVVTEYKAAVSV